MLNSIWLLGDRILRLGLGFFVSLQVTNYLGTAQHGLMTACMAFAALFSPFTSLGLDSIMVRELVAKPELRNRLMGTAFLLKLGGSLFAMLIGLAAGYWWFNGAELKLFIAFWQLLTFMVLSFDVVDLLYQSMRKSKYTVYAKTSSFILGSACRLWFLSMKAPLIWFVMIQFGEFALAMVFGVSMLFRQGLSVFNWRWDFSLAKKLLSESWMVALSAFVILMYMRIDAVMIEWLVGASETGIYAAAVRISEVWYFIPLAIVSSVVPSVVQAYQTNKELAQAKMQRLLDTMTWVAIAAGVSVTLTAKYIVMLYKPEFARAADVLVVHVWAGLFVATGSAATHYLILQGMAKFNFYRTLAGAVSNVLLNLVLIPLYGGLGAAIATLISYAISDYFSNALNPETRPLFRMILRSYQVPRLLKELRKPAAG